MKYFVKIIADGQIQETKSFEEAKRHAIALSNWNIECQILDGTGVIIKHFMPYRQGFKGGSHEH